ncbi:MAG TPA: BolA/IbaG family iron-sulfur metabolism protein [Candidatus Binatia bacterium]|nr:BolA/IbaG family iron-sulfur metabolism protein [Candidatus Binatia bacterium]
MIDEAGITELIRVKIPDAQVRITDLTGTMDHYDIRVRSAAFKGVPLIDAHRMVSNALREAHADGRIHAMQIKTDVPES